METLDNIIKTTTELKPIGYYDNIENNNNDSNNNINNSNNNNVDDDIMPSTSTIASTTQPTQDLQKSINESKWRQTKVLSSDSMLTNSFGSNNSGGSSSGNLAISPDTCNIDQISTTTTTVNSNNNNNNSSNNNNNNKNESNDCNNNNNNNNNKDKNLSYHRLRKGTMAIDKTKAYRDKRANILREILSTEQAYISFLKILVDVYLTKIKEIACISEQDINGIFSNIEAIKLANEDILSKLKEKIETPSTNNNNNKNSFPDGIEVSDVFLEFGPFLKIYSIFVNNYYNKAISIIKLNTSKNSKFKLYLLECKNLPASKKLDLNDLMIMPIQRLVRYVLLLEELIQHTPESSEPNEYKKLIEAKNVMKDVASFVNQSTVDKQGPLETLARVQQILGPKTGNLIQPHRRFIKSGELVRIVLLDSVNERGSVNTAMNSFLNNTTSCGTTTITNNGQIFDKRTINIYLFNDLLIYAINNKFWRKIYLVEVWIRKKEILGMENVFEIYSKSLTCMFQNQFSSTSSSSFQEWSTLIESTIKKLLVDDPDSREKRLQLEQDHQIQKDFTLEQRQFCFESLNLDNNTSNKTFKDSLIEDGIVEDRKKKIENLIINQISNNNNQQQQSPSLTNDDNEINEMNAFSDSSDNEQVLKRNNSSNLNSGGGGFSDNSDNEEAKKKRNTLKKRMQNQQQNQQDGIQRTSSSVSLFTQQLTGKGKSSSLSHIALTRQNIVVQGYLTKIGEVVKNWKRRWFIFENNYLFYLKTENSSKVLGIIPLIGSKIENIDQTSFNITTTLRTYLIIADSQSDLSKWTKAILEFYNSRDSFINNIKQQYSSTSTTNQRSSTPSTSSSTTPPTLQQSHSQQQLPIKRLSWLSASLPNNALLKNSLQNDKSKTIANFRFSSILKENNTPDSLSKSVDALSSPKNNKNTTDQSNTSNAYDDCEEDSLSSEEEFGSEEEEQEEN